MGKISFLFWGDKLVLDQKSKEKVLDKNNDNAKKVLEAVLEILEDESIKWDCKTLEAKCQDLCGKLEMKPRDFFQPIRVAIAGNMVSPPLFECVELMKREDVTARIKFALELK